MSLYEVLVRPLVTEKSTRLQEGGWYTFQVEEAATRSQVKAAVEKAFTVHVERVNIAWVHGRKKRMGRREVMVRPWKKAQVKLRAGEKLQIVEGM
ncbi:MAG: 50S ribosomal protein L23 [Chloroflexi bacterium]|nr:50S ribosomal protein L23 [Chloroflexota bacterium]